MRNLRFIPLSSLLALLLCGPQWAFGQNEEDALRYSNILPGGTARSWALGGAFGACRHASAASTWCAAAPTGAGLRDRAASAASATSAVTATGAADRARVTVAAARPS